MPPVSTAIIRCDQTNPLFILEDAFPDPVLRAFVQSHLGEAFRIECITDKHIIQLDNGLYALTPDYASKLWLKLAKIATVVVAAAKGIHSDIEEGIPRDVMSFEWLCCVIPSILNSNRFPHISLANNTHNILLGLKSTTMDGIKSVVGSFNMLVLFYVKWVREMIKISIFKGLGSEVNWGKYFGMTQEEFSVQVSRGTMQFGHSSLINKLTGDYEQDLALILHPTHSSMALTWFLDPYDLTNSSINKFIPKAYITEEEEDSNIIANFIAESL
ncbi:hypothetical protein F5879DRAFT_994903 [Lentinula edodes]|nr:hypothetical protein F5879DRAFT_994903 [Lentinula edodes]